MAPVRNFIFKTHLVVALIFGVFVVLLGITGSIMAFEPEIEHFIYRKLVYVQPQGAPMSLAQITDAVQKTDPNARIQLFQLAAAPNLSYQVLVDDHVLFVNQYTGQVLGSIRDQVDFLGYVHQLHLRLALLDKGRTFGEITIKSSGVAALFLVLSGAYLWWPTKRMKIRGTVSSRRFWFDVHNTFGILSFVFVLILAVTGLVIAFEGLTTPLLYRITSSQPPRQLRLQATPIPGATPITPDQALDIARRAAPGANPLLINVARGKNVYRINARYPEDRTPGGRTRVAVDPYSGKVLLLVDSRTGPAGYRLVNLNRAIHTGDIFGIPSKAVMSLASLIMALQLVTGVVMWLKRRAAEKRAGNRQLATSN